MKEKIKTGIIIFLLGMFIFLTTYRKKDLDLTYQDIYQEQIYQLYLEKAMAEYDLEIELNKKNYE